MALGLEKRKLSRPRSGASRARRKGSSSPPKTGLLGADLPAALFSVAGPVPQVLPVLGRVEQAAHQAFPRVHQAQSPAGEAHDLPAPPPGPEVLGVGDKLAQELGPVVEMVVAGRTDGRAAAEAGQLRGGPAEVGGDLGSSPGRGGQVRI